ncbi:MAG: ATP-binding cassette domain-containing protein [Fimbriimonadaceae bacterium]|nr:ATP-binding cassette domain-containing protein [Fimbriimonadaceae bacterium]
MLLSVSQVAKNFGIDVVLEDVSFRIDAKEKVALVGRNGTGKTTLLRILTQEEEPDRGFVQWARGAKVGKLRQEHPVNLNNTVLEEAQAGAAHLFQMQERLRALEAILDNNPTQDDLEEYARLHEHFSENEGYSLERDVRVVLQKMGFEEADFCRSTASLSGGEKTRLAIARLLLEEPDLLILDEPTNHLDLQATEWLESWIRQYHGAILLVSHDQRFLESTVQRVLELRNHQVKNYPGDFKTFKKLRAEEEAWQAELAERQAAQIAKLDEFVRRFMNSQRTAQARGRLKLMNRLIEGRVDGPTLDKGMKGGFKAAERSGDVVISCQKLSTGFPGSGS